MMEYITSREIMKVVGIVNVATLIRWHGKEKLIPPPEIRTHPNGRGKMAFWPAWVLDRCVRIKQLRKEGMGLAEIRKFLGSDWEAAARSYRRTYRFAEAGRKIDINAALSNIRELIEDHVIRWMKRQQTTIAKPAAQVIAIGTIEKAISMLEEGINPVFVITPEAAVLTADFAVSFQLARCRSIADTVLIIPIRRELSAFLGKLIATPLANPAIRPVTRVTRSSDGRDEERDVVVLHSWEFEVQPPKRRRTQRKRV